ncbi:MAG: cytidine deaminase [Oscillospiraceae bacterium]|jgi:cytidine deaminase
MNDRELLNLARDAAKNAYAPYSNFPVGAALECEDGSVFVGCNVENAAYGNTICAERVAIAKAVSEGHRNFKRIAIYGDGQNYCMPCGTCRQFMVEFSDEIEVLSAKTGGRYVSYKLKELLPRAFRL